MPAHRRELDSLVKRKTSTNSGSNRKKFNVNTTNIFQAFVVTTANDLEPQTNSYSLGELTLLQSGSPQDN